MNCTHEKFPDDQGLQLQRQSKNEESLEKSQSLLTGIINSTSDMIWSVDPETFGLRSFNLSLYDYFLNKRGIRIENGMRPTDLFPPGEYVHVWHAFYKRALEEGSFSVDYMTYANTDILQLNFNPLISNGTVFGIAVFGRNITENRRIQEELLESERRYRLLVETASEGILVAQGTSLKFVNQVIPELTGYTKEELLSRPFLEFIHPDYRELMRDNYVKRIMGELVDQKYEILINNKDASLRWVEISGAAIEWEGQVATLNFVTDISNRKHAEEALRASERTLRLKTALLEAQANATIDGILVINDDQKRVFYNRRITELFNVPSHILEDEDDTALLEYVVSLTRYPGEFLKKVRYLYDNVDETSRDEIEFKSGMVLDRYSAPVLASDGKSYGRIWTFRDITDQKIFEKERLKIEKLESLGALAGGIAHDFNNILAGIMGSISLARKFVDNDHKAHKPLETAEKASVRAAELARQLLTFAKGGEPVKKIVSIRHIAEESLSLMLRGSKVKASVEMPDSLHAIKADEGQISQVFNNIVINAVHAMSEGGILTISAQNELLSSHNYLSLTAGTYVKISISDQGCGISDADMEKIFDPYFTTKSFGNGLGLASVYSIVSRHGGHISVSSKIGEGTVFTIHVPSIGETYTSTHQADPVFQSADVQAGGLILVMDDEEIIRENITGMLEHFGYQVTTCADGEEAIAHFETARNAGVPFTAIIMDLTVPGGMGGKEAAQRIRAIDPTACLIVSSGYSNDPVISGYSSYGFRGAVIKPYNIMELGRVLSTVLSAQ
ncbi:MAG: PAS domain S-box protein [Desulfuromonadales bacterium]